MKALFVVVLLVASCSFALAQSDELISEHNQLTTDCRSVRGHAQAIVVEASQAELNVEVAQAHAKEVVDHLASMKELLPSSKKLLSSAQLKKVKAEYASLEKTCEELQKMGKELTDELDKEKPDEEKVRKIAFDMRTQMNDGYRVYLQVKHKLGLQ